jgi:hypothetical protein
LGSENFFTFDLPHYCHKASLDIFWLRDESLEEYDNLQLSRSMFNVQSSMLRGEEIVEDLEPPPSKSSAKSPLT